MQVQILLFCLIIELNNVIISIKQNIIKISICSNSDIFTTFVLLKFFTQKTDKILKFFSICKENKGLETYNSENFHEIFDYTLNDFLFYYNNLNSGYEYSTNFKDLEDAEIKLIGWELRFNCNISINNNDMILINKKIEDYRISKFKQKFKYD